MSVDQQTVATFQTKTGVTVRVRSIRPEDTPYLVDIFEHMSPESRYRRFHQTVDDPSPERIWTEADRIAQANPTNSKGLIAFVDMPGEGETAVGAARYVKVTDDAAETAMSVRDDWQNMGIGTRLLGLLTEEARAAGISRFVATVQNNNDAIWKLLHGLQLAMKRHPEGSVSEVEVDLNTPSSMTDDDGINPVA